MNLDDDCLVTPDQFFSLLESLHTFSDADLDQLESAPIPEADQHIWNVYNSAAPFVPHKSGILRSQMTDVQQQIANLSNRIGEARANNQPDHVILNLLRCRRRLYRRRLQELLAAGNNSGAARLRFLLTTTPEQELATPSTRRPRRRSKTAA